MIRLFVKNHKDVRNPAVHTSYGRMAGLVGIVCNLLLASGKLTAGILSGSIAITADAVNNLSDMASSVITLVGFKLSEKPADEEHPFGHARFEYIAGLIVALLVLIIGVELGQSSISKILSPRPVSFGWLSIVVLVVSILVKMWMAVFNRKIGILISSSALQATFVDSRNDVVATSAVLLAVLVGHFTGLNLDGWVGALVALFILYSGVSLVRETLNPLLGSAPDPEFVNYIDNKISSYPGVLGTHDLIVHDYGPGNRFASAHVEMDAGVDVMKSHDTIDTIERDFWQQDNLHLIIHYDPIETNESDSAILRRRIVRLVRKVDPALTIHDFRKSRDEEGAVHYSFDVVVPVESHLSDEEWQERIKDEIQNNGEAVAVQIQIDRSYAPIAAKSRAGAESEEMQE